MPRRAFQYACDLAVSRNFRAFSNQPRRLGKKSGRGWMVPLRRALTHWPKAHPCKVARRAMGLDMARGATPSTGVQTHCPVSQTVKLDGLKAFPCVSKIKSYSLDLFPSGEGMKTGRGNIFPSGEGMKTGGGNIFPSGKGMKTGGGNIFPSGKGMKTDGSSIFPSGKGSLPSGKKPPSIAHATFPADGNARSWLGWRKVTRPFQAVGGLCTGWKACVTLRSAQTEPRPCRLRGCYFSSILTGHEVLLFSMSDR